MAVQLEVRFFKMFGENKQRLAQWKLKSDWARDSSLVGQNPIGRGILRSRGRATPCFLRETAREAGLTKGNRNTLKPRQYKLQL